MTSLLEFMEDPELFGSSFKGASWDRWKVLLSALQAEPLTETQQEIYRQHTGRSDVATVPYREAALICGRRAGKSRIVALIATWLACCKDYSPYLAPGEVATIAIIASDRRQGRAIYRYILGAMKGNPMMAALIERETSDTIELTNRVSIEIMAASLRGSRGYTFAAILMDEIAYLRSEDSANPDIEIVNAVRPGLSTIPGAMLLLASSPYAKRGVLYETFRKHFGQAGAKVLVWKATTQELNPRVDPEIIAQAVEDDPERASAEYFAEWRSDVSSFVSPEVVEQCTALGRHELGYISSNRYVAFVDPSGGSADAMTLAIAHREGEIAVLDAVRVVKPPFSPEQTVNDFCALLKSYRISKVTGDRYAGEFAREPFRKNGISYDLSEKPKSDLYRDLLPVLNSGGCELLDIRQLHRELIGLERRVARSGRESIDHAPGGHHDDLANSVAGALLLAGQRSGYDTSMAWVGTDDEVAGLYQGIGRFL